MPLIHRKSEKAFKQNVRTEMHEHPGRRAQNLAIAYSIKRRARKAHGGEMMAEGGNIKAGKQRHENEKGVHPESFQYGSGSTSLAGAAIKSGAYDPGMPKSHGEKLKAGVKSEHERVLSEQRAMPKPKLPMAEGGFIGSYQSDCDEHCEEPCAIHEQASGFVDHEGNDVRHNATARHEDDMDLNQHGDMDEGAGDMNSMSPTVRKIMMGRAQGYSEGGKVANSDLPEADFMPNEFDDLHLRDDLEEHYTAENSGDELGNAQEDMDRKDVVSRIMASRRKKDRNPRPA